MKTLVIGNEDRYRKYMPEDIPFVRQTELVFCPRGSSDEELLAAAGGHGSRFSTGGMVTKLHAAQIATEAGIDVIVMNGSAPEEIYKALDGKQIGTFFVGKK